MKNFETTARDLATSPDILREDTTQAALGITFDEAHAIVERAREIRREIDLRVYREIQARKDRRI